MARPIKNHIEKIREGKGKNISREFFLTYTTPSQVTKKLYKEAWDMRNENSQKSFVMPIIQNYLSEWKNNKFVDTSKIKIPVRVERKIGKPYNLFSEGYLINLEPIFQFCKNRNIEFNDREKIFLKLNLLSEQVRKEILKEFPNENIIDSVLKYYLKNTVLLYFYYLREIRENPKKYSKQKKKAEEVNNPKDKLGKEVKQTLEDIRKNLHKRLGFEEYNHKIEFDTLKVVAFELPITPSTLLFRHYLNELEDNRGLVASIDEKILTALQIYPNLNKIETKKKTPLDLVKKVLRPDRTINHFDEFYGRLLYVPLYNSLLKQNEDIER